MQAREARGRLRPFARLAFPPARRGGPGRGWPSEEGCQDDGEPEWSPEESPASILILLPAVR